MRTQLATLSAVGRLTVPAAAAFAPSVAELARVRGGRPERARRASLVALAILVLGAGATPAAAADPADVEAPWRGTLAIGTTAVAANNVLPAPIAIGAGLLLERGMFGIEGAIHVDGATLCDNAGGGDGYCGPLWIMDIAPRLTVAPASSWTAYVAARFQLTSSRPHGVVPAAGPRLGVRYRGSRLGWYFEAGPSFVSERNGMFGEFASGQRWFAQVSTGIAFNLW